jgi:hypothetical protein
MINDDQLRKVEIKNLAKFLGDPDFIETVIRRERQVVAQRQTLLGVRFDVSSLGHG